MRWKLLLGVLALGGVGAFLYLNQGTRSHVVTAWQNLRAATLRYEPPSETEDVEPNSSRQPWDGVITVEPRRQQALGLKTDAVQPQEEPIVLHLIGTTAYNPDTLTLVRPRFDCLVNKVHATLGQRVKKGEPLVELYSNVLAEAKNSLEVEYSQWQHDLRLLEAREDLAKKGAIPQQQLVDTINDEAKSKLEYKLARDKLLVFGLTPTEIEAARHEDGSRKALMTLRSPTDGIVIKREVAPGNLYDTSDILMVIAPLEKLWVWGNISEGDASSVTEKQEVDVVFPFTGLKFAERVDYVDKQVDPSTRSIRFRTSIPNSEGQLKAGMYVRVDLKIPPLPGNTSIPRVAMVAADSANYVYVRKPGHADQFERRRIKVAQETRDHVIVSTGLQPGEEVVTNGSLILDQLYEDMNTVATGMPL